MLNWHSFLFKKSQKQQQQKKLTKIKHNETIKKQINLKKLILTLPSTQNNKWLEVDHALEIHLLRFPLMTNRTDKNEIEMMVTMMISIAIIKYCACIRNVNIK